MTTIIISNEKMKDTLELDKHLEESGMLNKGVTKSWKWSKRQFHEMLAAALVANVLTNMLGNTIMPGPVLIRAGEGTIRAGKDL